MKKLYVQIYCVLVAFTIGIVGCTSSTKKDKDMEGMESDAMELAAKIRIGWNLGNSLEVPLADGGETGWGNPEPPKH